MEIEPLGARIKEPVVLVGRGYFGMRLKLCPPNQENLPSGFGPHRFNGSMIEIGSTNMRTDRRALQAFLMLSIMLSLVAYMQNHLL